MEFKNKTPVPPTSAEHDPTRQMLTEAVSILEASFPSEDDEESLRRGGAFGSLTSPAAQTYQTGIIEVVLPEIHTSLRALADYVRNDGQYTLAPREADKPGVVTAKLPKMGAELIIDSSEDHNPAVQAVSLRFTSPSQLIGKDSISKRIEIATRTDSFTDREEQKAFLFHTDIAAGAKTNQQPTLLMGIDTVTDRYSLSNSLPTQTFTVRDQKLSELNADRNRMRDQTDNNWVLDILRTRDILGDFARAYARN